MIEIMDSEILPLTKPKSRRLNILTPQREAVIRMRAIDECLKAIADLPMGCTEDEMNGREQAYRAIELLKKHEKGE